MKKQDSSISNVQMLILSHCPSYFLTEASALRPGIPPPCACAPLTLGPKTPSTPYPTPSTLLYLVMNLLTGGIPSRWVMWD